MNIQSLFKSFDRPVISDFSHSFPEKGLFLIRGESGCGKTTLLRLMAGLEKPDSGSVESHGKQISVVFQEARLLENLSLWNNVLLVRKAKDLPLAEKILKELGLWEERDKLPRELSGGMKLRCAIARSLYYGGDIFLWDEPTKELDPMNRDKVIALALDLAKEHLVIAITHDDAFSQGTQIHL